ncbi:MAG: DNA-binding protein [Acholeplasmataceae bacterium]|nr:DNA-binding protein [Acholeplasmataceae bacterium]
MENLEKKEQLNQLYDFYASLLTKKQKLYFEHYYREDYSLHEIADLYGVSRNAVFDQLKKVEEHLISYESKLRLFESQNKRLEIIDEALKNKDVSLLKDLRKLDE